tara:strand:+ start:1189 stop:1374 length:186 start_codon:yes stop_codon:yes gene_type:complete
MEQDLDGLVDPPPPVNNRLTGSEKGVYPTTPNSTQDQNPFAFFALLSASSLATKKDLILRQ